MSTEEVKGRPLADDERADIERLLNTYGRLRFGAQISGIYYPAEVTTNDGKVRDWQGHVVADTNGHEAMADVIAFCLTYDFGPIVRRLLAENESLSGKAQAEVERLSTELSRMRGEAQRYRDQWESSSREAERLAEIIDTLGTAMSVHMRWAGTPYDETKPWDETVLEIPEELSRLRGEINGFAMEKDRLRKEVHDLRNRLNEMTLARMAEGTEQE